jgi:hypothetical protein
MKKNGTNKAPASMQGKIEALQQSTDAKCAQILEALRSRRIVVSTEQYKVVKIAPSGRLSHITGHEGEHEELNAGLAVSAHFKNATGLTSHLTVDRAGNVKTATESRHTSASRHTSGGAHVTAQLALTAVDADRKQQLIEKISLRRKKSPSRRLTSEGNRLDDV